MTIGKITNLLTSKGNKGKGRRIFSDSLHLFNDEIHKNFFIQGPKVKELPLPILNKLKREEKIFDKKRCSFPAWAGLSDHSSSGKEERDGVHRKTSLEKGLSQKGSPLALRKKGSPSNGVTPFQGVPMSPSFEKTGTPLLQRTPTTNEKFLPSSGLTPQGFNLNLFPPKNFSFIEFVGGLKLEIWKKGSPPLQTLIPVPPEKKGWGEFPPIKEESSLVNHSSSTQLLPLPLPGQRKGLHRKGVEMRGGAAKADPLSVTPPNYLMYPERVRGTTPSPNPIGLGEGSKEGVTASKEVNRLSVVPLGVRSSGEVFVWKGVQEKVSLHKGDTSTFTPSFDVLALTPCTCPLPLVLAPLGASKGLGLVIGVRGSKKGLGEREVGVTKFGILPSRDGGGEEKLSSSLQKAVENCRPTLEVRSKKIAGTTRQIPALVPRKRGERLAIQWILSSAEKRRKGSKKKFSTCFSEELLEAFYHRGDPKSRRDSLHKTAEANRSFLRYRWW
jgi:ribosomal protein S7